MRIPQIMQTRAADITSMRGNARDFDISCNIIRAPVVRCGSVVIVMSVESEVFTDCEISRKFSCFEVQVPANTRFRLG